MFRTTWSDAGILVLITKHGNKSEPLSQLYFLERALSNAEDMLLPRLQPPLRAALLSIGGSSSSATSHTCMNEAFAALRIGTTCTTPLRSNGLRLSGVRHASHKAQGAVNKAKDGPGKRLGAKKSGGTFSRTIESPFRISW
jgi:hypothetical protein